MSVPAIQLVGLVHPAEHSWDAHQQARLQNPTVHVKHDKQTHHLLYL